jgi:hypothetical protein
MNEAAALLVGDHDFRNLCKMDMAHVSNFRRSRFSSPLTQLASQGHLCGTDLSRERWREWRRDGLHASDPVRASSRPSLPSSSPLSPPEGLPSSGTWSAALWRCCSWWGPGRRVPTLLPGPLSDNPPSLLLSSPSLGLLSIEENPSKPEYCMAPDLPLVLHESGFEQLQFKYQPSVLWSLTAHYRGE